MVDVSTVKELARRWYPEVDKYPKKLSHLALGDILESIEELQYLEKKCSKIQIDSRQFLSSVILLGQRKYLCSNCNSDFFSDSAPIFIPIGQITLSNNFDFIP